MENSKNFICFHHSTSDLSKTVNQPFYCFPTTGWLKISHLSCMDMTKRLTNQMREYWYIGSMLGRSAMEKNKMEECLAIGRYPIRELSIFFSVSSAI